MWVFPTAFADPRTLFDCGSGDGAGRILICYSNSSGNIRVRSNQVDFLVSTAPLVLNTWSHVAFVRNGSACALYFNGVNVTPGGSVTNSGNWSDGNCYIGRLNDGAAGYFSGYISNMRIVKGTAVYTSAFTPQTTPLTNITNTSILTCQSNRFVDNSSNAFAITANGTPSVQGFGPFAPALQWTPDVVGGSGYFDGSDFLKGTTTAIGSGNFTIECWVYITSLGSDRHFIQMDAGAVTNVTLAINGSGNTVRFLIRDDGATTNLDINSSVALSANTWYHVCGTASGTTGTLYINGSSTLGATGTISGSRTATGTQLRVGVNTDEASRFMIGYIASSRIVVGTAIAPPSGGPTAPVTAVSGTSALLNYTNAGIYDGKMGNVLETVGNAQVATSPVKYGSGSMAFDGTGDWLFINSSSPLVNTLALGGGDFTVEMWLFPNLSYSGAFAGLLDSRTSGDGAGLVYFGYTSTANQIGWKDNTTNVVTGTVTQNVWNHVAVARANGILRMFINGIQVSSGANTTNYTVAFKYIGSSFDPLAFNGFMDDLRFTKGIARYIANFTPPQQALPRQ